MVTFIADNSMLYAGYVGNLEVKWEWPLRDKIIELLFTKQRSIFQILNDVSGDWNRNDAVDNGVAYIYLFSWHVIGIFNSLWFVIDIFNFSWSVNRQLTVNCDYIDLFTVNGDCLSENPVNCDLNITSDTWFRLLSVIYLGVAEIYIHIIAHNVPILMIFSQIFGGACPRTPRHYVFAPLRVWFIIGHPSSKIDDTGCYRPDQLYLNLQAPWI